MSEKLWLVTLLMIMTMLLSACNGGREPAVDTVEEYLNALISQDSNQISNLSCREWEPQALLELDSFQAVKITLEGLSCEKTGSDGDVILVLCQGKIMATYNEEKQEFDLNLRTYEVIKEGGEMRVCGYR